MKREYFPKQKQNCQLLNKKGESKQSIVYIEETQVIISNNILFFSLKIVFVLANSVDPDEIPLNVAFHQGLHCLPEAFRSQQYTKGYNEYFTNW